MSESLPDVVASDRGPGLYIEPGVVIPDDTVLAPHVTIYAGVEIGAGVSIGQGAIIGRPQQRDAGSHSPRLTAGLTTTHIGTDCMVGSGALLMSGATLLDGARATDGAIVSHFAVLEEGAMLGGRSAIGQYVRVGQRTRIQNGVIIGPYAQIGPDVLISPHVMLVGDPTMGRRAKSDGEIPAVTLGRACRIATGAIILPPVTIGEEAVVGAASLVTRDVSPRTVVVGSPARAVREVRDDELLEAWR